MSAGKQLGHSRCLRPAPLIEIDRIRIRHPVSVFIDVVHRAVSEQVQTTTVGTVYRLTTSSNMITLVGLAHTSW